MVGARDRNRESLHSIDTVIEVGEARQLISPAVVSVPHL